MDLKLEIANHPAHAQHPFTRKTLVDDNGNPVPLFPDQRSVKLDNRVVALVSHVGKPGMNVGFTMPVKVLTQPVVEAVRKFVEKELGDIDKVSIPIDPVEDPGEGDDD